MVRVLVPFHRVIGMHQECEAIKVVPVRMDDFGKDVQGAVGTRRMRKGARDRGHQSRKEADEKCMAPQRRH